MQSSPHPLLHDALYAALICGLPFLGGAFIWDPSTERSYRAASIGLGAFHSTGQHYPWLGDGPTFLSYTRWSIDRLGVYSGLTTGQAPLGVSIELASGLRRHLLDLGESILRLPFTEPVPGHAVVELAGILAILAEAIVKADVQRGWA